MCKRKKGKQTEWAFVIWKFWENYFEWLRQIGGAERRKRI